MATFAMKDSGQRETFEGGAVRDLREGKGRYDLITPLGMQRVMRVGDVHWQWDNFNDAIKSVLLLIESYKEKVPENDPIATAAAYLLAIIGRTETDKLNVDLTKYRGLTFFTPDPAGVRRLAIVYEKGAQKYEARNWEKGMPITRFIDSAERHLFQAIAGWTDEDHLGHAAWNLFAILHMETMILRGLMPVEYHDVPTYMG